MKFIEASDYVTNAVSHSRPKRNTSKEEGKWGVH
jgi:hypothetical protein